MKRKVEEREYYQAISKDGSRNQTVQQQNAKCTSLTDMTHFEPLDPRLVIRTYTIDDNYPSNIIYQCYDIKELYDFVVKNKNGHDPNTRGIFDQSGIDEIKEMYNRNIDLINKREKERAQEEEEKQRLLQQQETQPQLTAQQQLEQQQRQQHQEQQQQRLQNVQAEEEEEEHQEEVKRLMNDVIDLNPMYNLMFIREEVVDKFLRIPWYLAENRMINLHLLAETKSWIDNHLGNNIYSDKFIIAIRRNSFGIATFIYSQLGLRERYMERAIDIIIRDEQIEMLCLFVIYNYISKEKLIEKLNNNQKSYLIPLVQNGILQIENVYRNLTNQLIDSARSSNVERFTDLVNLYLYFPYVDAPTVLSDVLKNTDGGMQYNDEIKKKIYKRVQKERFATIAERRNLKDLARFLATFYLSADGRNIIHDPTGSHLSAIDKALAIKKKLLQ